MAKKTVDIICAHCGSVSTKRKDNVRSTMRRGGNLFCNQSCALAYRGGGGTPAERLAKTSKPNHDTGCLEWLGYTRSGYGSLSVNGRQEQAHRVSYEIAKGPIPGGLFVCHKCDNRLCINIDHLFLGTNRDNVNDMVSKRRHNFGDKHPGIIVTTELKEKIRELVGEGAAVRKIADLLGLKRSTVGKYAAVARKR